MEQPQFVDYYELLMVSPNADRTMIEWAVRLMLTRYGPKSPETADQQKYDLVKAAYRALSDPARRSAYDAERADLLRSAAVSAVGEANEVNAAQPPIPRGEHGRLHPEAIRVQHEASAEDVRVQQRLRQAVLSALYEVMLKRPRSAEAGRAEIARTVGCRTDDLEFPIWFLREQEMLRTSVQGLYEISVKGVEWVESGGVPHLCPSAADPLLLPPSSETAAELTAATGFRRTR